MTNVCLITDAHNLVPSGANWTFIGSEGEAIQVPIFAATTAAARVGATGFSGAGAPGVRFNPTFERMFRVLFGAVAKYLAANQWAEHGSWVQVVDEPSWWDDDTVANTIALTRLYRRCVCANESRRSALHLPRHQSMPLPHHFGAAGLVWQAACTLLLLHASVKRRI